LAVKGCEEIVRDIPVDLDYICCACGTGTTLAGIINSLKANQQAIGIPVLKGGAFLEEEVKKYCGEKNNFRLIHDYHFGGYAKSTSGLEGFCKSFMEKTSIPAEPVYTGKLFFGIYDLIRNDFFPPNKTIVMVHTGGIFNC
jgi:1-aminocyclopropane-1-carboxylate deaminase/D-cysteine desulfhydrase-like pyridoxal-dependent ACC family enzyme